MSINLTNNLLHQRLNGLRYFDHEIEQYSYVH